MSMKLNINRLQHLIAEPFPAPSCTELRRQGSVFFIGGNLAVYETLETMYASYCQESADLFLVSFGERGDFERNLELVRQIKKNFSVRLMGRIAYEIPAALAEQAYLAGLDVLDLPTVSAGGDCIAEGRLSFFRQAAEIFPRWSLVSSLPSGASESLRNMIDALLAVGIVPLIAMTSDATAVAQDEIASIYKYLQSAWQRHEVQIKPLLPLVRLLTPLDPSESTGRIRSVINRIQDRHQLATSDLRRHLRTSGAEASFESAGL